MRGYETVTVERATGPAPRHGEPPAAVTTMQVSGCTVLPRTSSEDIDPRANTVIVGLTLIAPGGTDLRATDVVVWQGERYEVEGEPGDYRKRGASKAVVAALRRVMG